MKRTFTTIYRVLVIACLLGSAGCKRTPEAIARWKSQGQIEKLFGALSDGDRGIRISAAKALGDLKAESAVEPLAALFSSPDSHLVIAAVEALVSIGNPPAENHLLNALSLKDRRICTVAILGLGSLKSTQAINPLVQALNDGDDQIATAAATALGLIGDEKAIDPLAAQLQSRSFSLRLACVKSLGSIGGETATGKLTIALGDINKDIRQTAIDTLAATGEQATPYALAALRDSNAQARLSAVDVLTAIDAVPTEGSDFVWHLLAQVSTGKRATINTATLNQLASMGNGAIEALLEAVAHDEFNIREHAFRALENIGEPCVAQAIETANEHASHTGKLWFAGRSSWQGAPDWRIDLWGAATALDPTFQLNRTTLTSLRSDSHFPQSSSSKPLISREYIPILINQLGNQSSDTAAVRTMDLFGADSSAEIIEVIGSKPAKQYLLAAGDLAAFPLIAALESSNQQIVDTCAEILGEIGDKRATPLLVEALSQKIAAGEKLSYSPLYLALQKQNDPAAESILLKIRPNAAQATRIFERQYQGSRVIQATAHNEAAPYSQPIAFTLRHVTDGKAGEVRIIFKKDESGNWVPTPPLPAELT